MYEILDDYISYIEDIRNYSDNTANSYYDDIKEFIIFLETENINKYKDVDYSIVRFYLIKEQLNILRYRMNHANWAKSAVPPCGHRY